MRERLTPRRDTVGSYPNGLESAMNPHYDEIVIGGATARQRVAEVAP
jgi:hypothetical protein